MIIYLYVKTHNKTGLKYLGKTIQDPYKYRGSGKTWKTHISEHGYDVTTEILKECIDSNEISYWGRYYSNLWDIVNSDEWANKIPETGGGPGFKAGKNHPNYGKKQSKEVIEKRMRNARGKQCPSRGRSGKDNPFYGKTHTDIVKKKLSEIDKRGEKNGMFNKKHKDSSKALLSKNHADVSGEKNPRYGKKKSPEEIAKMLATKARNRENKYK